mmetsp:Transcript_16260/g.47412  ORF Transcript_16260/g.47412 Transcript_16260/m.47412 type:complete len:323 (-) Transcript_16260:132-1100(-)
MVRVLLILASAGVASHVKSPHGFRTLFPSSVIPQPPTPSPSSSSIIGPFLSPPEPPQDDEDRRRQHEFRINVGKVIDTLQTDYPHFFTSLPDFSIYEQRIELTDPSGVSLRGLQMYKNCFGVLRLMGMGMSTVEMRAKVCYAGWDPYLVRVRWNLAFSSVINPGRTFFLDGVSAYTLSERGFVKRHELQNIIFNGRQVEYPYLQLLNPMYARGLVAALGGRYPGAVPMPTLFRSNAERASNANNARSGKAEKPSKKQAPRPLFQPKGELQFCEGAFDCEYPLFCCDLLFAKLCCRDGAFAPIPRAIPIPIPVDDVDDRFPGY